MRTTSASILTLLLAIGVACGPGASGTATDAGPGGEESADARRFELRGEVVAVDSERATLTLDHAPVEGYMDAMTMPFNVVDDWVLDAAEPGARVRATLVVEGDRSWLEDVVVRKSAARGDAADVVVRQPDPGAEVPVIDVVNQDGEGMSVADLRGEHWVFTFIYTRCPLPDFCPRVTEGFRHLYEAIEEDPARYGDAELVSVTVDPAHDTPEVLREYALEKAGLDAEAFERWHFVRAEPEPLGELAHFTGLRFMPDAGEIVHSLRTVIVDPQGRVVETFVGNTWEPAEVLAALEGAVAGDS